MAPLKREKRVNLQVTEAEHEMLQALAEREGVSMSDFVRQQIRRMHAEAFPASAPKARKAKR